MPFFNDPQSPLGNPFPKNLAGWAPMPIAMGAVVPGPAVGPVAAAGGAGSGSLPGTYNPASGGIPRVPTSGESLQNLLAAISGNVGNLGPIISGITGAQNQALKDQYPASYFDTLKTLMDTNAQRAQGNILDSIAGLGQYAGEWGIGRGVSGGPAANTNLLASLALTKLGVQNQALQNAGAIQNLIPKVAPYDAARLLPTYGDTSSENLLRNIYGAAPIPESAYARARADALAGLNRGFNAGGGGYGGGYGRGFGAFTPPTPTAPGPVAGAYTPAGGWPARPWQLPPPRDAGVANIGGLPGMPFEGDLGPVQTPGGYYDTQPNLWDNPLDMPQDPNALAGIEDWYA